MAATPRLPGDELLRLPGRGCCDRGEAAATEASCWHRPRARLLFPAARLLRLPGRGCCDFRGEAVATSGGEAAATSGEAVGTGAQAAATSEGEAATSEGEAAATSEGEAAATSRGRGCCFRRRNRSLHWLDGACSGWTGACRRAAGLLRRGGCSGACSGRTRCAVHTGCCLAGADGSCCSLLKQRPRSRRPATEKWASLGEV